MGDYRGASASSGHSSRNLSAGLPIDVSHYETLSLSMNFGQIQAFFALIVFEAYGVFEVYGAFEVGPCEVCACEVGVREVCGREVGA